SLLVKQENEFAKEIETLNNNIDIFDPQLNSKESKKRKEARAKISEFKQQLKVALEKQYRAQRLQKIMLENKQLENFENQTIKNNLEDIEKRINVNTELYNATPDRIEKGYFIDPLVEKLLNEIILKNEKIATLEEQLSSAKQKEGQIPIKQPNTEGVETTYYADVKTCEYLFKIVSSFFGFNINSKGVVGENNKIDYKKIEELTKAPSYVFNGECESIFHNLYERKTSPVLTHEKDVPTILAGYNMKLLTLEFKSLLEKISNFSHQYNVLSTQVKQLKSALDLEKKQISQSLITMNQQYERRINVMQTYFINTTYTDTDNGFEN
ncbi:MAG: hypothetical protein LBT82_03055, partial [Oscillospiraceae bacterium]|nr:hypothetical protein [Oscillospiraceae bacterium]